MSYILLFYRWPAYPSNSTASDDRCRARAYGAGTPVGPLDGEPQAAGRRWRQI